MLKKLNNEYLFYNNDDFLKEYKDFLKEESLALDENNMILNNNVLSIDLSKIAANYNEINLLNKFFINLIRYFDSKNNIYKTSYLFEDKIQYNTKYKIILSTDKNYKLEIIKLKKDNDAKFTSIINDSKYIYTKEMACRQLILSLFENRTILDDNIPSSTFWRENSTITTLLKLKCKNLAYTVTKKPSNFKLNIDKLYDDFKIENTIYYIDYKNNNSINTNCIRDQLLPLLSKENGKKLLYLNIFLNNYGYNNDYFPVQYRNEEANNFKIIKNNFADENVDMNDYFEILSYFNNKENNFGSHKYNSSFNSTRYFFFTEFIYEISLNNSSDILTDEQKTKLFKTIIKTRNYNKLYEFYNIYKDFIKSNDLLKKINRDKLVKYYGRKISEELLGPEIKDQRNNNLLFSFDKLTPSTLEKALPFIFYGINSENIDFISKKLANFLFQAEYRYALLYTCRNIHELISSKELYKQFIIKLCENLNQLDGRKLKGLMSILRNKYLCNIEVPFLDDLISQFNNYEKLYKMYSTMYMKVSL